MSYSRNICVITGGQTGVDRAAMDVALRQSFSLQGYCPRGRRAEDGTIPAKYPLRETKSSDPEERTLINVKISQGTLILFNSQPDKGTEYTKYSCIRNNKPYLEIQLNKRKDDIPKIVRWLNTSDIQKLNIAGPRESESPGIYKYARAFLNELFLKLR
jgi:hypothetical protein